MKFCTKCGETKSVSDFGNNKCKKDGLQGYCRVCSRALSIEKQYDKKRWVESRSAESERSRLYRLNNLEKLRLSDRAKAKIRRESHPGVIRAHNIARKHGQKLATPAWSDLSLVNAFYVEAKRLESMDGIPRHVDHEIPLKHKLVCGLHVPGNLRVLTATENMRKHNAFEVTV